MSKTGFIAGLVGVAVLVGGVMMGGTALAQKPNKPEKGVKEAAAGEKQAQGGPLRRVFFDNLNVLRDLKAQLNLTDDQLQKIRAVIQSHRQDIAAAVQTLNEKHKALLAAVRAPAVDEAAIRAAAQGMTDAIATASVLRANVRQEVMAILTPDQRAQVDKALDEMQQNKDEAVNQVGGGK